MKRGSFAVEILSGGRRKEIKPDKWRQTVHTACEKVCLSRGAKKSQPRERRGQ